MIGVLALLFFLSPLIAGCPQPIEIAQTDQRPDAAVAPLPPRPICRYEPREAQQIQALAKGTHGMAATAIRIHDTARIISILSTAKGAPQKLRVDSVARDGSLTKVAETEQTGSVPDGDLLGINAVYGGGKISIAITRTEAIDVLYLTDDGSAAAPPRRIPGAFESAATILQRGNEQLLFANNTLRKIDDTPVELSAFLPQPTQLSDAGPQDVDGGAPSSEPLQLPLGIRQLIIAGNTVGWLRSDAQALWLDHLHREPPMIITTQVAPPDHEDVQLLWAGDRYLVGDSQGSDIARFIVDRPRNARSKSSPRLRLGGRMTLPRPPEGVLWSSWDNAGARHIGIVHVLDPRRMRFLNVALGGMIHDAEITFRRTHDIIGTRVLWDGRGYVLIWGERENDSTTKLYVARFTCPDES